MPATLEAVRGRVTIQCLQQHLEAPLWVCMCISGGVVAQTVSGHQDVIAQEPLEVSSQDIMRVHLARFLHATQEVYQEGLVMVRQADRLVESF